MHINRVRESERPHSIFMEKNRRLFFLMVLMGILALWCLWGLLKQETGIRTLGMEVLNEGKEQKKLALTFDDGPHPQYTKQILDGLQKRDVHATFFVTGENAELYPELVLRMKEEGHLIGNHTYSHIQLTKGNREVFRNELIRTNEVLERITGEGVTYVRPPYGSWDKSFEMELNMIPVLWNIDPLDWCSHDVSCIIRKIESNVRENDIILMHDAYPTTVTAALQVIDDLRQQGYAFVTVEEILFD